MINIRLTVIGDNIGYSIRPTERQKRYGTKMLSEALSLCKAIGLRNIIIVCKKDNIESAKMITNCDGVLDEEFYSETYDQVIQKYRISK